MDFAKSIDVSKLSEVARVASDKVLADRMKGLGGKASICCIPHIGTIGVIIRDAKTANLTANEGLEIATEMMGGMGELAKGGKPVAHIFKDIIIAGYFPIDPIIFQDF